MDENDPRRKLDDVTAYLVEILRQELELSINRLVNSDRALSLAQVAMLRKDSLARAKNWTDEFSPLSHENEVKVVAVVVACLEETFDSLRETIIDRHRDLYPDDPE